MTDNTQTPSESLLKFPCEFTIKVFGAPSTEFEPTILAIIKKHANTTINPIVKARPSENGKYVALSITITAESKEQMDHIYQDLTACPLVLMAL
jgi:putative lipoic acid-binding regulatory protein